MAVDLAKTKEIFNALYADVNGRGISLKWREDRGESDKSFVYGEVLPDSFYEILSTMEPRPGQIFYDMGSGVGKPSFLAYLLFDFKKAIGIELVEPLFAESIKVKKRFDNDYKPVLGDKVAGRELTYINGDFLKHDVSDGDIMYLPSTCYSDELMAGLEAQLECLKPHAYIATLSKPLRGAAYHQYKNKLYDFTWGQATIFYHRRRLWNVYA